MLIRHGQASFGSEDYDVLSDVGESQSRRLAQRLSRLSPPTRLVEGSLTRQRDTAAILADALDVPRVDPDARWDEYDHEELLSVAAEDPELEEEFRALGEPDVDRARAFQSVLERALRRWTTTDDGAYEETWTEFVGRCWAATDDLLGELGSGQSAAVITSGGVISAVCAAVLGLGPEQWLALNRVMVNSSVTRVVRGRGGTSVVAINDHAHLEDAEELLTYR